MDYALLPPEFNSGRIYTGPGSASFVDAAASWDGLATELESAADGYRSAISALTALHWRGPASASMAAAVLPFVGWLDATAAEVRQTADQARAAAAAFDQVRGAVVPPAVIAANRTLLQMLIATNWVGQNSAAIADTEAAYAAMWAQDTAAMYQYAGACAAATSALTPFTDPAQTTNPTGLATQASAGSASGGSIDNPVMLDIAYELSAIASNDLSMFTGLASAFSGMGNVRNLTAAATTGLTDLAPALSNALGPMVSALKTPSVGGAVTAALGRAGSIGPLSVPARWAAPTSAPVHPLSSAGLTTLSGGEPVQHSMPGVPGALVGNQRGTQILPRYGARLTVMPRPPAAG
ncbi:PPE family protein [Mycobacterium angelicum]|uniref:PPE family protein n=1 Tax=Mycobacterium angelicum TaxID=470074 RepID=A0A1X0A925_MYCAN|nr:PPE family protein [Mycobacterium angelicum]MCV7197471.1 PPE family protein [Mycobacterium angelicum]ORA26368.1 hypothetical protein BST12_00330 [Mycobacterium angelicum]